MPDIDSISSAFLGLRSRLAKAVSGIVPPKEIEDIVQETYLRVRQAENLDQIRRPESFLYRTARNLALDHVKRAESRLTDSEEDIDSVTSQCQDIRSGDVTLQSVVADEEFAGFCDAVRYLPEQCRRAFVLRKVYGFSQKEIAAMMTISESTVEKHIALGVKRTFQHMKNPASSRGDSGATISPISGRSGRGSTQ